MSLYGLKVTLPFRRGLVPSKEVLASTCCSMGTESSPLTSKTEEALMASSPSPTMKLSWLAGYAAAGMVDGCLRMDSLVAKLGELTS